jgi:hypothetical protein
MKPPVVVRTVVVALLVAACGAPGGTASPATSGLPALPTGPATPRVAPMPTVGPSLSYAGALAVLPAEPRPGFQRDIRCSGEIGADDPVVLVTVPAANIEDDATVELRDFADPVNPRTVCSFGGENGIYDAWLLDSRHVVIRDGEAEPTVLFAVVDLPEVHFRWFALPPGTSADFSPELITVSPKLDQVLWNDVHAGGKDVDAIHVATGDDDQVIATVPDPNEGRCGEPSDSSRGRFARSWPEAYILVQPIDGWQSLLVYDGTTASVLSKPPSGGWAAGKAPQMAVWSPRQEELYWSQGGDAWRWTPDMGMERSVRGVTWFDPTFSADGRYLAYIVGDANGVGDLYLWDMQSAARPAKVAGSATTPRFLDATQLWYLSGEAMGECTSIAPTAHIHDAASGATRDSDIPVVLSAWPATSAQD